jgi:AraC-like DNA-binding protein
LNKPTIAPPSLRKQPLPGFITENEFFAVYPCDKMTVFRTLKPCPVFRGEFSHLSYEFIFTETPVSGFTVDGQPVVLPQDTLFPINSGQLHGTRALISDLSFMNIQFERDFLLALARDIYGVRELRFENKPMAADPQIKNLVRSFIDEYCHKREGYSYILSNLSVQIAVGLFRQTGAVKRVEPANAEQQALFDRVVEHFRQNYEKSFSLDVLSGYANMSKFSFARKFKEMTGQTPLECLTDIRIMKALEHLQNPNNKIIDVAMLCGFKNHSHFSQVFRQRTGMTPKEYRIKMLGIHGGTEKV